ncbi:MAG: hypothetical protein NTV49_00095 [Kiritimatiellaeota bacterium]|nr:hypothetical protein [Kiritimatiellota bacterium]
MMKPLRHRTRHSAWRGRLLLGVVALCAWSAGAAAAGNTNAAPAKTKPTDYQQILQRVRQRKVQAENFEIVQQAVRTFQMRFGRMPSDLNEIQSRGVLDRLPPPPPRMTYAYNPATGTVRLTAANVDDTTGETTNRLSGVMLSNP